MRIRKSINWDMDGTIANLYSVPNWLEKLRAEDPSPYLEADPMCDMKKLAETLNLLKSAGWEINIITWLSMNSSEGLTTLLNQRRCYGSGGRARPW